MTTDLFKPQKVQHPIRTRLLEVKRVTELSPAMRRITLTGDDLAGFLSASFDDHLKLLVPEAPGAKPNIPTVGPAGLTFAEGKPRPEMRDYTPRRYDPVSNELDIDFVLHHDGPATEWASHAEPGHWLGIAGPRGSFVIPTVFDWHLLLGDETAIPAIARRLEELPATSKAIVVIKTAREDARIELHGQCERDVHWVSETENSPAGTGVFESTLRDLTLPQGEGYVWAAGEYSDIKAVRRYLVEERGIDKSRIRAASYWRKSAANSHEHFD
ncbi:siderophore-interacting protein [Pseudomonas sp. MYb185]|uniref:siderophore-interacting protein n=1 Tax=Pseudomonas sp. MYb185 TaxID=1848729 RepID=UPI000CFCEF47|nr:siderophore-interacting protein [Pseudomonas sp. MYb185]PRB82010.1 NADPH-dependent ferric siderophore reductase [Pseudomonas sp. MYb185]